MGRWSYSSRYKVEDCKTMSIFWLHQRGCLTSYRTFEITWDYPNGKQNSINAFVHLAEPKYLQLDYYITDSENISRKFDYKIPLTSTNCNLGGSRYWFVCPLLVGGISCKRRVGILYLPPNGSWFGCRHCYNLTYASRLRSGVFKGMSGVSFPEIDKLREKVKKRFYKGKMTRSYKRFLVREQKLTWDLFVAANYFKSK